MKNLTYIIPVIEILPEYLDNCFKSLSFNDGEELLIVGPKDVINNINTDVCGENKRVRLVENNDKIDYASQVNLGVSECSSKYFTIVECDDSFTPTWFKNADDYAKCYEDVSLFLPLLELVDDKSKNVVALGNELSWSTSFVNDLGYIDDAALESFYDFQITGGIFDKEAFLSVGGMKSSLKIAQTYELLLRLIHNNKKIYTIPKIGYRHTINRVGSYMTTVKDTITREEGEWLIKTAQEEKFFNEDRNRVFEEK